MFLRFYVLLVVWCMSVWEIFLHLREYHYVYSFKNGIPSSLMQFTSYKKFQKAQHYRLYRITLRLLKIILTAALDTFLIMNDVYAVIWYACDDYISIGGDLFLSLIWSFFFNTVNAFFNFAFALMEIVYLRKLYEPVYSKSLDCFIRDYLEEVINQQTLYGIAFIVLFVMVEFREVWFLVYLWLIGCITLMVLMAMSDVIFTNKIPVKNLALEAAFENLALKFNFPTKKLYLMSGKRDPKMIARISGYLGFEQVYIQERALHILTDNEILAVLAQQLGHWAHEDNITDLFLMEAYLFVVLTTFAFLFDSASLYNAFGFSSNDNPFCIGICLIIWYILLPVKTFFSVFSRQLCKRQVFKADLIVKDLKKSSHLIEALIRMNYTRFEQFASHPLYHKWYHDFPTVVERYEALCSNYENNSDDK